VPISNSDVYRSSSLPIVSSMDDREIDIRWPELVRDLARLTSQKTLAEQVGVSYKEVGRWIKNQVRPQGANVATLLKICDDLRTVNWRKYSKVVPVYDFRSEYDENVQHGPQGIGVRSDFSIPCAPTRIWEHELNSPLGIPASVLTINSGWIEPFSRLGFDILTYKTCRTREFGPHTFPHIKFLPELTEPIVNRYRYQVSLQAVSKQISWVKKGTACALWKKQDTYLRSEWVTPSRLKSLALCRTGHSSVELALQNPRRVSTALDTYYITGKRIVRKTASLVFRSGIVFSVMQSRRSNAELEDKLKAVQITRTSTFRPIATKNSSSPQYSFEF